MLSGVYGYFFGEENSNDSVCSQENAEPCSISGSTTEDDWFLVEEECASSGRNSPVIIPVPEVRDIDSLSFASMKSWKPPTEEERRRASELKAARAASAARLELERALFAEVEPSMLTSTSSSSRIHKASLASAAKLKRATAAAMVATDAKTKSRSKKAVKTPANRNNNRKCNNLD